MMQAFCLHKPLALSGQYIIATQTVLVLNGSKNQRLGLTSSPEFIYIGLSDPLNEMLSVSY